MFVKICGTTSEEDALLAVAMGADAVGFVFAPSQRQVAPRLAADIAKRLPPQIVTVGVFRDEAPRRVLEIAQNAGLRAVQLHGRETAESCKWLRSRLPMVIKGFPAGAAEVRRAGEYGADVILLDGAEPGSGRLFDWAYAGELPAGQRLMVAGGLTPSNVAEAIARTNAWGVDVVSGVERRPGVKDPIKLREFMAAARAAAAAADGPEQDGPEQDDPEQDGPAGDSLYDWREDE
ncbi:MAG: phosphoribosylanthranilate isomerase [Acidimicrobiales bacterium]